MRIAVGYFTQETNTFSPLRTRLDHFELYRGEAVGDAIRGDPDGDRRLPRCARSGRHRGRAD
jgi:hypothetical protein